MTSGGLARSAARPRIRTVNDSSRGDVVLGVIGPEPEGATPIDAEDLEGLIPDFVATRADLNQVEYENIANSLPWALRQVRVGGTSRLFDDAFVYELHRRMFSDVWTWAGSKRRRETNIGVAPIKSRPLYDRPLMMHAIGMNTTCTTSTIEPRVSTIVSSRSTLSPMATGAARG